VVAAFAMMMLKTFAENAFFYQIVRISIQVKVSIVGAVYRKALRLTPAAKAHHTEGEILNLMQQDSERLQWFTGGVPAMLISGSLQIVLNSCLLFYCPGPPPWRPRALLNKNCTGLAQVVRLGPTL
jgi:ATP-binding cassette subfamily C (CFTR/MRP) protein 1